MECCTALASSSLRSIGPVILRACDPFAFLGSFGAIRQLLIAANGHLRLVLSMSSGLRAAEAVALQDVVGEGVPEHDGTDLFDAAHGQLPQVPVAPAGMDAFAYRAGFVPGLARFARHSRAPGQYPPGRRRAAAGMDRCHAWIEWADKRPRCLR